MFTCSAALHSNEMYVFSMSQKCVSIEIICTKFSRGQQHHELTRESVLYKGDSSIGPPDELKSLVMMSIFVTWALKQFEHIILCVICLS